MCIRDRSLHIRPGEIYGFIGHNGAGKTTTIKSCCGILQFEEGEILIDGTSVKEQPLACKAKPAYIPDNPDLYDFMTGIQFLNFVADIFKAVSYTHLDVYKRQEKIVVAGDSAGGGLALALCRWLKNHKEPLPSGVIAMSPWTDLTISGESVETNFEKDPLFGKTRDSMLYNKDYLGDNDPTNEYISPLFGDYEGFPPLLIQVGSYEMLLSDSTRVAKKAKEAGGKVKLSIYEGMFHVFQMAMLLMPESKKAWAEIKRFLHYLDTEENEMQNISKEEKA